MESSFITIISIFISLCTFIFTVYKFKKQKKWNSELEKLKYTFEHNLTSYKIYIELKHKRIIKVNQCMIEAYSAVMNISSPFQTYPDFSRYTMSQISNFLDKISLGENEKDGIMSQWDLNKEYAIKEVLYWYDVNDTLRMYNFNCITDTIVEVITTCNTYTLLTVHLL